MKKSFTFGLLVGVMLMITSASYAYTVKSGDSMKRIASQSGLTVKQLWALNPFIKNPDRIRVGTTINTSSTTTPDIGTSAKKKPIATTTPPVIKPPVTPPPTPTSTPVTATGETRLTAYTTSYAWPDNTPPGSDISNPVIHQQAGGTGTFADPITLAVGHSIIGGKDILDYAQGTKFYLPNLRRYFIAEDTCGDGNTPQNGACHKDIDHPGYVQLDLWAGGVGSSQKPVLACEDAITDLHAMIINPASNYAVVAGPIFGTSCSAQYGDTIVTQ